MKNKGFTVVEFAVSFCLIAAVALLLFELVLSLKNIYLNGNIKSTLLTRQGIMLQRINDDYDNNFLRSVTSCGLSCLTFTYTTPENTTKTTILEIDPYNKTIAYDDYTMKLDTGNEFGDINVTDSTIDSISNTNVNNSLLTIEIPIYNTLLNENFDIKINMPYKSSQTSIDTTIDMNSAAIVLDDMRISVTSLTGIDGYYAEMLSHDVTSTKELFTSVEELKRSETENKTSALFTLNLFKAKYNNSLNTDVFEFVLMYPDYSTTENNHWYQSSNFLISELENYTPIAISWNNNKQFYGIDMITEDDVCGFANTNATSTENCYTNIGAKKLIDGKFMFNQDGIDLSASIMKLYVRCDEYINKYALANVVE